MDPSYKDPNSLDSFSLDASGFEPSSNSKLSLKDILEAFDKKFEDFDLKIMKTLEENWVGSYWDLFHYSNLAYYSQCYTAIYTHVCLF